MANRDKFKWEGNKELKMGRLSNLLSISDSKLNPDLVTILAKACPGMWFKKMNLINVTVLRVALFERLLERGPQVFLYHTRQNCLAAKRGRIAKLARVDGQVRGFRRRATNERHPRVMMNVN